MVFVSIITSVFEVEWVFNQNVNKEIFEWWCSKNCIHLKLISCEWKLNVNQYYAVNNTQQSWKSRSGRDYFLFFHPEYWNLGSPIFVIAKVFHFSTFTKHENKHSLTSEWKSRYLNWMIYLMHAFICFQFCVWISFFFVRSIAENVKCKQPAIHTHTHSHISFFLMQWSTSKSMSLFMVKQNRRFCLCSFSNALCAYVYVLYVAFFTVNVRALKMRVLIRFGMWNSKLWRVRSFIWWRYNRIIIKQSDINNISFSCVFGKWLYMNEF